MTLSISTISLKVRMMIKHRFSKIEKVTLSELNIHEYQRPVNPGRVKDMAITWDPRAVGILSTSIRPDSSRWLLDGKRRRAAGMLLGIKKLQATVHEVGGVQEEAELFQKINFQQGVNDADLFNSKIHSKDPRVLHILELCAEWGVTQRLPGETKTKMQLWSSVETQFAYRNGNLNKVLEVLTTLWSTEDVSVDVFHGDHVKGFSVFFQYLEDLITVDDVLVKLAGKSAAHNWKNYEHCKKYCSGTTRYWPMALGIAQTFDVARVKNERSIFSILKRRFSGTSADKRKVLKSIRKRMGN